MRRRNKMIFSLVAFAIVLVIATVLSYFILTSEMKNQQDKTKILSDSVAGRIEERLLARTYLTRTWEILISGYLGDITEDNFNIVATQFCDDYADIERIMLIRNNNIDFIYPQSGNYYNPVTENKLTKEILAINGPVDLGNGERGIIISRRLYLGVDKTDDEFWGYSVITLNLNQLLNEMAFSDLEETGMVYKLTDTYSGLVLIESDEESQNSKVETVVNVPDGGTWILSLTQKDGWVSIRELLTIIGAVLIISILTAYLVYSMLSLKARGKDLEKMSYYDNLTGLLNPRSYKEKTEELKKKKAPYCLIYMDLNDFKHVNDTYGHKAGDELLKIVSKRLANSIRDKDNAYRVGGDEFVVVTEGSYNKNFIDNIILRIRENVARDVVIGGGKTKLKVSISCGYARYPEDGKSFEEVAQKADDAMYYNKRLLKARRITGQDRR